MYAKKKVMLLYFATGVAFVPMPPRQCEHCRLSQRALVPLLSMI
jgi:hypothetical protein